MKGCFQRSQRSMLRGEVGGSHSSMENTYPNESSETNLPELSSPRGAAWL